MKSMRLIFLVFSLACLSCLAFCLPLEGSETDNTLTVKKINDPALRDALSVPDHVWAADGTLLLYDKRLPKSDRGILRYRPDTGERAPACDTARALASLAKLRPADQKAPDALSWPEEFDPAGRRALYLFDDDIFLLDLSQSTFSRLTRTPGEEKNLSFSPDGRRISFVRDNNLYWLDPGSGREQALTRDGNGTRLNGTLSWVYWEEIFGRQDTAAWWAPDSTAIAYLQSDDSRVEESVFPEFEPPTPRVIKQRYPKAGGVNPAVRMAMQELKARKPVWVKFPLPLPEYILRAQWLPDGRQLAVQTMNRAQNEVILWLADRRSGKVTRVLTETSPTSINTTDDLYFIAGGSKFIWASERDGHNHLYLYDIQGRLVRRLTEGDWTVRASSGVAWVRGGVCAIDEKNGWVYFTASTGSPMAPNLYRTRLDGGQPERLSKTDGTHRVSFDRDARWYVDAYSNAATLTGLYLRHSDGSEAATLAAPATDVLAAYRLQYPEYLTIPATDGFPLPAQIIKPRDFDPGRRYPVIIYVYGGPSAPVVWNVWERDLLFDNILLENGFICVNIDNRSATGQSKTLEDTVYRRFLNGGEVEDIVAGVRWLQAQPYVDPERIGVWGWSGGGSLTLQLMTHSTVFKAGIAVAAVSDPRYYDTKWTESVMGLPAENPDGYRNAAPANFAKDLSGRLLLVHGTYDDNVHPQNALRFAHELIEAGIQFDMMFYPLEKHGLYSPSARVHVYEKMLDFWRKNL